MSPPSTLTPMARRILGPVCAEAVEMFRRPSLPNGVRYALLLRHPQHEHPKPMAFPGLAELARHIHRARGEAGLQLAEAEILLQGETTPRKGVSVWTLETATGDRRRFIGWAWLGGAGRYSLEAALQSEQPGPVH